MALSSEFQHSIFCDLFSDANLQQQDVIQVCDIFLIKYNPANLAFTKSRRRDVSGHFLTLAVLTLTFRVARQMSRTALTVPLGLRYADAIRTLQSQSSSQNSSFTSITATMPGDYLVPAFFGLLISAIVFRFSLRTRSSWQIRLGILASMTRFHLMYARCSFLTVF